MNKGRSCESYVRKHFPAWSSRGWLPFQNHKDMGSTFIREGEPFDFTLIVPCGLVCLECKETEKDVFKAGTVQRILRQANNLERVRLLGHAGWFVVMFISKDGSQQVGLFTPRQVIEGVRLEDSVGKLDETVGRWAETMLKVAMKGKSNGTTDNQQGV